MQLLSLLHKYQHLFDGSLGIWNDKPNDIELKPNAKPYHSRPFQVPKIHEMTLKIELECLTKAGVLKKVNQSKWAAPTFLIPKKDATVRFISDFCELTKELSEDLIRFQEFKTYCRNSKVSSMLAMTLDLNMGYYHIESRCGGCSRTTDLILCIVYFMKTQKALENSDVEFIVTFSKKSLFSICKSCSVICPCPCGQSLFRFCVVTLNK